MFGYIDNKDFVNLTAMKYWSFPSSYSKDKRQTELHNAIFSGSYWGALKVDGFYQRLVKDEDGNCFMIARSPDVKGNPVNKYEWVPQLHPFMESIPNGSCFLCECYLPGNEGSKNITTLLGCLKNKCIERQEKGQKLHFYIFDCCAWNGKSWMNKPALERFDALHGFARDYKNDFVEWAHYYNGEQLWDKLGEYLASGREGIVITRAGCPIYEKRSPAHMTLKIKKELTDTIDVIILGANPPTEEYTGKEIVDWRYWQNTLTGEKYNAAMYWDYYNNKLPLRPITKTYYNRWAGSLKIGLIKNGAPCQIGSISGMTEEVLSNWHDYIGKVAEISAMEIFTDTEGKGIRHPKFIQWRNDKTAKECTYESVYGA